MNKDIAMMKVKIITACVIVTLNIGSTMSYGAYLKISNNEMVQKRDNFFICDKPEYPYHATDFILSLSNLDAKNAFVSGSVQSVNDNYNIFG
jgi:hypothetical protein